MKHYSTSISTRLACLRRSLAPTLVLGALAGPALAQTQAVSGQVKATTGEGLPGVNVILKGTSVGTTTNAEGKYSLAVYDAQGRLVETLATGSTATAGELQRVKWQFANQAAGLYLVRLTTDAGVHQMKIMKQ